MPKKNNNINNNTNKDNGRESIMHNRISKQSKKYIMNHNNAKIETEQAIIRITQRQ